MKKTKKERNYKMSEKLLTMEELMQLLSVSRSTLDRWRKNGLPFKKVGRSVRFDYKEVRDWIDEINK